MLRLFLSLTVCLASLGSLRAAESIKVAQRWALLVGVDDYAYAQKLEYCGADQLAFGKQLVAAGFPPDQVFVIHDQAENPRFRPSLGNIERQLGLILNLADEGDLVVLGFSGHGVHINGKSFLCPAECTLDDPKTLIPLDDVYRRLQECAATFKLVVVDACRNDPRPGGARSMQPTDGTRALARTLQELKLPEGVVLLNSCAPGEISWEDREFGHGVFMHFVLEGMAGSADANADGSVSLQELQGYAGSRTKTYVANRHSVPQRPFFKGDLTSEALEYALLPVPGRFNRFDATKPATLGIYVGDHELKPAAWHVLAGGPADVAGVQVDDVITSVDGRETANGREFDQAVDALKPGQTVDAVLERGGKSQTVRIVVEAEDDERLVERLRKEAEAGSTTAMVQLGDLFLLGLNGVPKDPAEAARWFRRAADAGDALGLYSLAVRYYWGGGVPEDDAEALQLHEAARAVTGFRSHRGAYGSAASGVASVYFNGNGTEVDLPRAAALYQEAADLGHARAAYKLAGMYDEGNGVPQDKAKALECYLIAAACHHADAEINVGYAYENGLGTKQDYAAARSWYERSFEHGSALAATNLGALYEAGLGMAPDPVRAAKYYQTAVDRGDPLGKLYLGRCYENAVGVAQDYARALELYQASAEDGNHDAEADIGDLYHFGLGVPIDYRQAFAWYERAAAADVVVANYNLGVMYREARGTARDYAKAMHYFQIAAKQEYGLAENDIGALIYHGQGVRADAAVARGWYESAAKHGEPLGMFNLAELYELGEGGPQDLAQAKHWYAKAAELGDEDAKKKLAELK